MTDNVVSFDGICKCYRASLPWKPSKIGLNDVTFALERGSSTCLIGHNGAGKSTAIGILLGLRRQSAGEVRLQGRQPSDPRSRIGVAYLPERPLLYDKLTAREHLNLSGVASRLIKPAIARTRSDYWLERFGLTDSANRQVGIFSKGMQQRVALAQALAMQPEILILDEPMSGLDFEGRQIVLEVLQEFRCEEKTLIFSSHEMSDVIRLAEGFVRFSNGRTSPVRKIDELFTHDEWAYEIIIRTDIELPGASRIGPRTWLVRVPEKAFELALREIKNSRAVVLQVSSTPVFEKPHY